ncbi:hypothetical protein CHLNCDRAFT_140657 [Chlorella variabilis]|uniref:Morc S5 domain-containing protein n=1 Tax=Chlorella variabilis TaxID=554065 RepID=E1Z5W6_CHLVA|nr:hypothetical protein CHLNCDRAFT_140657 [Chlorella variabilis]EFN58547.1 hypothetical protein CHLNCDRAFT_140657 [Chlorella variabilis]|eukprot:XP_005850649.1 hypothetical protein CHLNCDRAFT_140657 [Chlorella variabilis]
MTASQPSPAAGSTETVDTVPPHQPALFPSHYPTPFSAIATLLAGCLLRCEQSSGTYAHVDLEMQQQQGPHQQHQLPVLVVEDDAAGLSPQQLRRSVGIPQRANSTVGSSGAAGGTGSSKLPDLVHAALRLGSLALVLTKRRQQGASVALLTCTSAAGDVEAVVVDFAADGSQQLAPARKAGVPATAAAPAAATAPPDSEAAVGWQAAMDAIGRLWPSHGSKARLQQLLDAMPEQGTRLLIAQLRRASHTGGAAEAAAYELDWAGAGDLKAADVLGQVAAAGAAGTGVLPSPQGLPEQPQPPPGDPGVQRCMAHRHSLRAYMGLLFLRWPAGFRLRLRGSDMQHTPIRDKVDERGFQMQHVVQVHTGFLADAPHTVVQGICLYHSNRLVKPFWKAFLKRTVPAYWKRHAHLLDGWTGLRHGSGMAGQQTPAPPWAAAMQQQHEQLAQGRSQQQQQQQHPAAGTLQQLMTLATAAGQQATHGEAQTWRQLLAALLAQHGPLQAARQQQQLMGLEQLQQMGLPGSAVTGTRATATTTTGQQQLHAGRFTPSQQQQPEEPQRSMVGLHGAREHDALAGSKRSNLGEDAVAAKRPRLC